MTLQERLRAQARWVPVKRWVGRNAEVSKIIPKLEEEAADALDAQEKRIKELEGALRVAIKHWEGWCDQNNGSMPDNVMGGEADDYARALEALK